MAPARAAWVIMPFLGHETWEMTQAALADCLAMGWEGWEPQIVLVHNGVEETDPAEWLEEVERWVGPQPGIIYLRHTRGDTVDRAWNGALDLVFSLGADRALVVNNDVRLHRDTWRALSLILDEENALFVTGVGVQEEDWTLGPGAWGLGPGAKIHQTIMAGRERPRGGPDFSCFMIRRACHQLFKFDHRLSYFGDNDYHRRMKLAGHGDRIFGVDVPFLHLGSRTINRTPETARAYVAVFEEHRKIYREKWGGDVGQETREVPAWDV